ncbi:SigE family RNA polymerase sigma factor [Streptomyces sp. NBC_00335]|uniref:SigE family RNA polymerase sigma factor n=1 Tax=unclassified Streptomyces TaxID=2593676 RepID=UPI0022572C2C|nr:MULTISPECIES: SigE family RNA polymerase sigma factor [unclassified Streptomyces]MCX5405686.1 SigE family RNA polymerase sigma factor [Streptomyces sp. NBC_00086]
MPGGFPVIVPVPPAAKTSGAPLLPGVPAASGVRPSPAKDGRVPGPRDSAEDTGGTQASQVAATAEVAQAAEIAEVVEVVAGTTVDHLTETYQAHYRSLLGLAALLLDDTASCEDVVQEAFIRVHSARNRVRDREKTLAYLRQTVVNLSRSALRRRILGLKLLSKPMPDMASAEEGAYDLLERDDLIKAMRGLQRRQREVLSLRYFADMTEVQVSETLGISLGSVKAYGSRGIAALRVAMEAAQA